MHPRSGIQALYDSQGGLVVKVEEYYVPPRRLWLANNNNFLDENFDYTRKLLSWTWNEASEKYSYDSKGKMTQVTIGKYLNTTYAYRENAMYPYNVSGYSLIHDPVGGLREVITPLGFKHGFHAIPLIGMYLVKYRPPWSFDGQDFTFCLDLKQNLIHKVGPGLDFYTSGQKMKHVKKVDALSQSPFTMDYSGTSVIFRHEKGIYLTEKDLNGRILSKTLVLDGKVALHQTFSYVYNNKVSKHSLNSYHKVYSYNAQGHLTKLRSNDLSLDMDYDNNGNLVTVDFGNGLVTSYKYEFGERIGQIGQSNKVSYDQNGNLVSKNLYDFSYFNNGSLKSMTFKNVQHFFTYPYSNVLVHSNDMGEYSEYFYDSKGKIVRVVSNTSAEYSSLFYDHYGHVFALEHSEKLAFVASDEYGTPIQILDTAGNSLKSIQRTPFGLVWSESGMLHLPIGYHGQFEINGVVLYKIQVQFWKIILAKVKII